MARLRGELARRPGPPGAAAPRVRPGPGVGPAACGLQAKAGRARGRQLAGRSLQTDGQTGEPQLPRGGYRGGSSSIGSSSGLAGRGAHSAEGPAVSGRAAGRPPCPHPLPVGRAHLFSAASTPTDSEAMAVTVSASSFSRFCASTREYPTVGQRRCSGRQYWPGGGRAVTGCRPGLLGKPPRCPAPRGWGSAEWGPHPAFGGRCARRLRPGPRGPPRPAR